MGAAHGQGLPRQRRITRRWQFTRAQKKGIKLAAGPLLATICPNDEGLTRLGLTVSKKVGKAVTRALVRRRLREAFRRRRASLPEGLDCVLIAKPEIARSDFGEIDRAVQEIVERATSKRGALK